MTPMPERPQTSWSIRCQGVAAEWRHSYQSTSRFAGLLNSLIERVEILVKQQRGGLLPEADAIEQFARRHVTVVLRHGR